MRHNEAMSQTPSAAAAPRIFDRALVRARQSRARRGPAQADFLFDRVADDLVDRLAPVQRQFGDILDCGSARPSLAAALGSALPEARLTRLATVHEPASARWETAVGDEEAVPFGPGAFDLAVSGLALHAVNDLPGALVQLRRCLKPDGLFLGCLLGGQTLTELRTALAGAEAELLGGASPRVAPFADLRDLGGLLQRAGFALPVTDTDTVTVRYASLFGLMADLRAMGFTNALADRSRRPLPRAMLLRAAAIYAERFADADGRLRATFEIIWLSGWSPHESQQKPLQPGTAKMRLADALAAIRQDKTS